METLIKLPKNTKFVVSTIFNDKTLKYNEKVVEIAKDDVIVVLREHNFKFSLLDLDQEKSSIQTVVALSTNFCNYRELTKIKKQLRQNRILDGFRIFHPTTQKMLWLSKADYESLTQTAQTSGK